MKRLFSKIVSYAGNEKGYVVADQLVFSGSSFITTVLMARVLGPQSFGAYAAITLFLYLMLSICNSLVIQPFQVRVTVVENKAQYLISVLKLQLAITALLMLLVYLLLQSSAGVVLPFRPYTGALLLLTGTFLMQDFFRRVFISTQKAAYALITDVISASMQLVFLLAGTSVGCNSLSFSLWVVGLTSLPAIVAAVYLMRESWRKTPGFPDVLKLHWQQGRWLLLTVGLQWWAANSVVVLAGLFLGIRALGALRLAQTILGLLTVLFQVLENYAVPRASAIFQESSSALKKYLVQLSRNGLLLLVPVLLILFLFPETVYRICGGEEYLFYTEALRGIALLNVFVFAGYPLRIAVRVMLMNRAFFTAYLLSFLFTLFTAEFIIAKWQLAGVIAAMIMSQFIILAYLSWTLARKNFYLWK